MSIALVCARRGRGLIGGALLLAACDPAALFSNCSDDLLTTVTPRTRTLRVGESYTVTASAQGCRGRTQLSDQWRYFAADSTIVHVDSLTGRVSARTAGATDVGARGALYGDVPNRSRVTVTR